MELHLTIGDPQVADYVSKDGPERVNERAGVALRVGVIALSSVRGEIDAETVRREGERVIEGARALLEAHAAQVAAATSGELARYLDPKTGVLEASIAKLREGSTAHIDILNGAVQAQVGETGMMARTLMRYIGEGSPLLRMLDPGQENGLRGRIEKMLQDAVQAQRTAVLAEFSLDRPDSALSRLLRELGTNNAQLTEELSLDKEDSALSRLVTRVEAAAAKSTQELTLDNEGSALNRLRSTLEEKISALATSQSEFHGRVLEMLTRFDERAKVSATGTQHGFSFEFEVLNRTADMAEVAGDLFEATGTTTGVVRNCKVGDGVVTLGPDKFGAGKRIVIEAKEDKSYTDNSARTEIELAMKNREAEVGIFVFSKRTASTASTFRRFGNAVLVVWDQDDRATDIFLTAAYSLATALITRAAKEKDEVEFDFTKIDTETTDIEKQAQRVAAVRDKCESIRRAANAIEEETRIASEKLLGDLGRLRAQVDSLRAVVGS